MGLLFSRVFAPLFDSKEDVRLLMLGLDGSGKTTTLYKLKLGEVVSTIPTIGFNVETVEYKSLSFTVWDVGGQTKLRPLWRHYYRGSRGLIYLVDSNDTKRMEEAQETLYDILSDEELAGVPVLVLANKQDLPRALPPASVAEKMKMGELRGRAWHVQGCNALTGDGIYEGMDWLAKTVKAVGR